MGSETRIKKWPGSPSNSHRTGTELAIPVPQQGTEAADINDYSVFFNPGK